MTLEMERDFDPKDNFPSTVMDALQRMMTALGARPCPIRISPDYQNTLQVPAGAGDAAAGLIIDGRWRWNETAAEQAGSGGAGQRDVWACATASSYVAGSPGETDSTDRSFVLRITAVDASAPGGFTHTRRIARALWSGAFWQDVVPFVGGVLDFGGAKPGDMKPWPFSWEPIGWEFCDATVLTSPTALRGYLLADGTKFGNSSGNPRVPDLRGRVPVGEDGAAARLDASDALGNSGGAQKHTLTTNEMPSHTHTYTSGPQAGGSQVASGAGYYTGFSGQSTGSAGGDQPHNNMQPYQVVNWLIKL